MTLVAFVYEPGGAQEYDDIEAAVAAEGKTWVHAGAVESTEVERLKDQFGIHQLAVEDVTDEQTRPKTEEYETHTFVLMKTASLSQRDEIDFHKEVRTTSVGLFIGQDWLVTLSPAEVPQIAPLDSHKLQQSERVANRGVDFLAYRIIDTIVDEYFGLLDDIEDDIEDIEEGVFGDPDPELLESINDVRRDLLAFRKVAWPAREAISSLSRGDISQVSNENEKYYRDIYDHLVQVVDLIETYRDLLSGSRDVYLNAISQSTNDVMKTLTVVATIFIPLTFVVGVYGMNFSDSPFAMPELTWTYGYPATMFGMVLVTVVMLVHFRRQDWI